MYSAKDTQVLRYFAVYVLNVGSPIKIFVNVYTWLFDVVLFFNMA